MRRVLLVVGLLGLVVAAAACGDDDDPAVDPPATTSTSGGDGGAIDDPRPTAIESVSAVGESQLELTFYNGTSACYGVDRVDVEETSEAVTIGVFTGRKAEARDRMCIDIAELVSWAVTLAEPLGDRPVIDASTGAEVPLS